MVANLGERFEHPWLVLVMIIGLLLYVVAYAADVSGMQWAAAFLGIYATLVVASSLLGYMFLGGLRVASQIKDRRHSPTS